MNNFVSIPMNDENSRKTIRQSSTSNRYRSRVTFVSRTSPFTNLQSHQELQAAYGVMISIYICFVVYTLINYISDPEWRSVDYIFLSQQLNTFHYCLATWIILHILGYFIIYPMNSFIYHESFNRTFCFICIILAMFVALILPPFVIIHHQVRFLLTFMLIVEQIRLLMKYISFTIENSLYKDDLKEYVQSMHLNECFVLETQTQQQQQQQNCNNNGKKITDTNKVIKFTQDTPEPNIDKFTYFLFAPTLIYRPCYPRSSGSIIWWKVLMYGGEFFAFWFLGLQMLTKGLLPFCERITNQPMKLSQFTLEWFHCGIYASTIFFGLGYGFLHCWLNMWAEMLHFADRQFYREWYICNSVGQFWRRWNYMVHTWFSEYIYSPLFILTGNRALSISCVYLMSGIAHEYATGFALRIFLPVLGLSMFFCFPLTYLVDFGPKKNMIIPATVLHFILWFSITNITLLYGIELSSRDACPPPDDITPFQDFIIPRFISCLSITY